MLIVSQVPPTPSDSWAIITSLAAAASAAFAGFQILLSRRESQRQSAFALLRIANERLANILSIDIKDVHAEIIAYYGGKGHELSPHAEAFLRCLNDFELLSLGRLTGVLDEQITDEYMKSLFQGRLITLTLIKALRENQNDAVFEYLYKYLIQAASNNRGVAHA